MTQFICSHKEVSYTCICCRCTELSNTHSSNTNEQWYDDATNNYLNEMNKLRGFPFIKENDIISTASRHYKSFTITCELGSLQVRKRSPSFVIQIRGNNVVTDGWQLRTIMIICICAGKTQKFASLLIHEGNYQNNDIQALSLPQEQNKLNNMIV